MNEEFRYGWEDGHADALHHNKPSVELEFAGRYDDYEVGYREGYESAQAGPIFTFEGCVHCRCPIGDHEKVSDGVWTCDGCDGNDADPDGWCRL